MNKKLICYCSGGLGNRIRPLSSCYSLAKKTERDLIIIWVSNFRCRAEFVDLYQINDYFFKLKDCQYLSDIGNSIAVYGNIVSVECESVWFKNHTMENITDKVGLISSVTESPNILFSDVENVIVISNDFLDGASKEDETFFIREVLKPKEELSLKINKEQEVLNLDETFFGVHARGTDFFVDDEYYCNLVYSEIPIGSKLFICSDSEEIENSLKSKLSKNFEVYFRNNKFFVEKCIEEAGWFSNTETSVDCTKDGLVDMYLLAKTNFTVYNQESTFAEIVQILSS